MPGIAMTLFAAPSRAGQDLQARLKELCASRRFGGLDIDLDIIVGGDQEAMLRAGLSQDVVVFDASIEDPTGSNYKATHMWPCVMDHFLVVSRTRLPVNYSPFIEGGTPETWGSDPLHRPSHLDNSVLIQWLEAEAKRMRPRLPRPASDRLIIPSGQIDEHTAAIAQLTECLMDASRERKAKRGTRVVFVSYLSRYSTHSRFPATAGGYHVEDALCCIQDLERRSSVGEPSVFYYPPGTLSSEFMTEHRRWQVLSMIVDRLRSVDAFWIFETDDYYASWWTLAELACLAYLARGEKKPTPEVLICSVRNGDLQHREAESAFIQTLTDEQAKQFWRYLYYSNPLITDHEMVKKMQGICGMPRPLQWLAYKAAERTLKRMPHLPLCSELPKNWERYSFKTFREKLDSPVYNETFWTDRLAACVRCSKPDKNKHRFDFESFLRQRLPGLQRVSESQMDAVLERGLWQCDTCGHAFDVVEETFPQYRWWPVRRGRATGPGGAYVEPYVERLPVYVLRELASNA